jgi:acyl-CoA synthetase (AMP-forming)/AMP-acid ligase II/acyl carrier protein
MLYNQMNSSIKKAASYQMMNNFSSIPKILKNRKEIAKDSAAILALGKSALTYSRLWELVLNTNAWFNQHGIGRGDCVAIVLPNGPQMAAAFLATASSAVAAPLNPNYRVNEFEFYLEDLQVKALIVAKADESSAREAAKKLGIAIFELEATGDEAGLFILSGDRIAQAEVFVGLAEPDDTALVLHTSGTTSRPKIVPLTHTNLTTSAINISRTLSLSPTDRCLNIMPLFHIHGLAAALLASLEAGASLVCTPGFIATEFYSWLEKFSPSWYTAVPTMHQAILSRSEENRLIIQEHPLRFIRSCSASLPPQVMKELEQTFSVSVVEAYGMTEAAHQMTCNPLTPGTQKPGSVGIAAGPEVAIMSIESDDFLETGKLGEVVIHGVNVTSGYLGNPEANRKAFTTRGWFRTGDQGYLDSDGYLFLTGRLKEIINRAGEKISPREIDEVLLSHPAVKQAVAFSLPDPQLGEAVAAAVILNDENVTVSELRHFASTRLAAFKIPDEIVVLQDIPKGPTGKLQRVGLAEKLGLTPRNISTTDDLSPETISPQSAVENYLFDLWCSILKQNGFGITHTFLSIGGDSILAALIVSRIREQLDIELTLLEFFDAKTVKGLAQLLENRLLENDLQTDN